MLAILKNKQILYLFLSSFAVLYAGMGLFPILPLYLAQFKASTSITGLYFASIFSAYALGPVVTGWLVPRFPKRLVFIAGSLIAIPALVLLGSASNLVQVFGLTSLIWFSAGVLIALVSIFTGLHSDSSSRGKAYSLIGMAAPLGSLVGGASVGRLVGWYGYAGMFTVLAAVWSVIPLVGWLFLKEPVQEKANRSARWLNSMPGRPVSLGSAFLHITAIAFVGSMVVNLDRFGSSVSMHAANYSTETVSNVTMVSGLVAVPLILAIGVLSDRLGRKHFLSISYLCMTSGALILAYVSAQWQYALAASLIMVAFTINLAMTQALASEVLPARSLDQGLSRLNTWLSIASIVGFAVGGLLFDLLGLPVMFLATGLAAMVLSAATEVFVQPAALPVRRNEPCLVSEGCGSE